MKIGIDISPLFSGHKVRGVGSYVSLLKENIEKFDPKNSYTFFKGKAPEELDVVHYPYFDPFFPVMPFQKRTKTVVTVHDLIPIKFKKYFPSGIKGALRWQYNKRLLKSADRIIVDSVASKNDVIDLVGVKKELIDVVYLGVDSIYKKMSVSENDRSLISGKYDLPKNFFLYVGDVTWNKNLPRIIESAKKADVHLLLVGKALVGKNFERDNPWNRDKVKVVDLIERDTKISALGFVSDEDLLTLYNLAEGLLMPSLYEGFGLPVLEAMSTGCPVITSRLGSLPEVGGDAVLYTDAESIDSIAQEIDNLYLNKKLQNELSEKGLERARKFSVERMMKNIARCYR